MELTLVIPTYNEAGSIGEVIQEWHQVIRRHIAAGKFRLLVVNDGSTDETLEILKKTQESYPELSIHSQPNRGHGQACLEGYRMAAELGSDYTMQIDSDGQCDPIFFENFWEKRGPVCLYGRRFKRWDGLFRKWVSGCLRWTLYIRVGTRLHDPNVPYRVYPTSWAAEAAGEVPPTFDLANVAVALLLESRGSKELPIHFRKRSGGRGSVRWVGFVRKAFRLFKDLRSIEVSRP